MLFTSETARLANQKRHKGPRGPARYRRATIQELADLTHQHRHTTAKQMKIEHVDLYDILSIYQYVIKHNPK